MNDETLKYRAAIVRRLYEGSRGASAIYDGLHFRPPREALPEHLAALLECGAVVRDGDVYLLSNKAFDAMEAGARMAATCAVVPVSDLVKSDIKPGRSRPPREYDPPLDPGIKRYVEVLYEHGIETFESCEGGSGHAYKEPTVRFRGERGDGFKALAVALIHRFPVDDLRRVWPIIDGEPTGPYWELTFYPPDRGDAK